MKWCRIAVSVFFLTVFAALMAITVRSFWRSDYICYSNPATVLAIQSNCGEFKTFWGRSGSTLPFPHGYSLRYDSADVAKENPRGLPLAIVGAENHSAWKPRFPIWAISIPMLAAAAAPRLRWRFSLRTVLVTMTVLAAYLAALASALH